MFVYASEWAEERMSDESLSRGAGEPDRGRRALAAIVFTDVVAFTKRAATDEPRTFAALRRDFALFAAACERHGGRVVNTMGDGSLMLFDSAVAAMEAAVEMQEGLHRIALARPPEGVLEHRIGVHLGDVVQGPAEDGAPNGKAYGDGINVASRIEALCRAGAVTYSRAVAEVVGSKLDLGGIYLGPRAAKNVPEPIPLWEVPPINEQARAKIEASFVAAAPTVAEGATGRKGALLGVLAFVVLAVGFGIIALVELKTASNRDDDPLTAAQKRRSARKSTERKNLAPSTSAELPTTSAPPPPRGSNGLPPGAALSAPDAGVLAQKIREMSARYDFAGIVELLQNAQGASPAISGDVLAHYQTLAALRTWADSEASSIPPGSPVSLGPGWPNGGAIVYASGGGAMIRENGRGDEALRLWNRPPAAILLVLVALSQRPGAIPPPEDSLPAFAAEYGLPDH